MIRIVLAMLANVHREMDDYHHARSEAWQEGEQGEAFLERMDLLAEIIDLLEAMNTPTTAVPTIADAVLDRLVHNAYRIALTGESMRKKLSPLTETND